ncbi:DUF255 domain-containing protein [Brevibacillus fulvus]|uniref:Uncharacterized protein YyaL (SSP411 family) n=1 Tax=Brevibacillus fulvus TaxID=1125967 RepID=A0A939BQX5_9BACL|nr:uncharacterized protein YyaL (SSP411 family) [Brevibacillus fulvus]
MTINRKPNRLANEKSPYLLQHAYNPVDWYPWSDEAFAKAKAENKPIFLSIGYSTCHWCHVMERESFENEQVAELLNEQYVAIKVDREERPDVDHLYMTFCQALTGQGGWPLTILMTPEKQPFFAGTYFPRESKWGHPGLLDILGQLADKWAEDRAELEHHSRQIVDSLTPHLSRTEAGSIGEPIFAKAVQLYQEQFDPEYGGFGEAPKFPTPHNLLFLLRHWKTSGEHAALGMVEKTLQAMQQGGIYDHVGFGFARYSVDREWRVPHFEKMLYDNALLAYTYLEAYEATGNAAYATTARQIFSYVLRDMTDRQGGFYSAEDADSEGVEGKFYVWTPEEVSEVLGPELGALYCEAYDITRRGNFEGHSIPNLIGQPLETFARRRGQNPDELGQMLEMARQKLFAAREQRVHPGKDDKVLTAWNGLMIAALAKGARVLNEAEYLQAAEKAVQFILTVLRTPEGRLLARYRDGEVAHLAYLDDYAFVIWGLLELYQASQNVAHLREALSLTDDMLRLFGDEQEGGLFFYGSDAEQLLARPKEIYDGATPSGNGVAAYDLLVLFYLTGRMDLRDKAETLLQAFAGSIEEYPIGYSFSLLALQLLLGPVRQLVIAGEREAEQTALMLQVARTDYEPLLFVAVHEPDGGLAELSEAVRDKRPLEGKVTAYLCQNFSCQSPVTEPAELDRQLVQQYR